MAMSLKVFSFRSAMRSSKPLKFPFQSAGRSLVIALGGVTALALAGCDDIGSALDDNDETFHIRSINLVEDAPTINFLLGDTTVSSAAYGGGSAFTAAHPGSTNVSLEAVLPVTFDEDDEDDDPIVVRAKAPHTFLQDTPYTLVAYGRLADPQVFFIEGWSQRAEVADDKVVLQFAHAAPEAPQLDVYVTAPQAGGTVPEPGVTVSQYVATLNITEASAPLELSLTRDADDLDDDSALTGEVIVELRAVGSAQLLYESEEILVAEQTRMLFTITHTNGPGPSVMKLVSLVAGSAGQHLDRNDGAALRFAHVSPDTPPLDVTAGSSFSDPLAQNVGFRGISEHINVESGEVGMIAVPTGNAGLFVFLEEFTADAGQTYSAYAMGPQAEVDAVVISDDARSVPTQSSFRFLHAAASLEEEDPLDIYLRLPGEGVDFDDDENAPTFASVAYQNATGYLTFKEGDFEVYFVRAGTSSIVLGPVAFQVVNGDVSTFVLLDTPTGEREIMPVSDVRL